MASTRLATVTRQRQRLVTSVIPSYPTQPHITSISPLFCLLRLWYPGAPIMEPGDGSGGSGRPPLPSLTGGLRLDDLADTEPDADPTPIVVHFRSTMASMGYAVTLRLDSATSPTSPDDDGRSPFSPLVTPTPATAALRRARCGPSAPPRSFGGGRFCGGVADSGGAPAAGDRETAALSSPVSASTPGGGRGGGPPLPCSSVFFPSSPPSLAVASRSAAATTVPRVLSGGGGQWDGSPGGNVTRPSSALSPLPPLPPLLSPLLGGLGDIPSSRPHPRTCPRHPLLDAPSSTRRSESPSAPKRPFAALLRGADDSAGGWWSVPPPAARPRPVRDTSVVLAPLRSTGGGGGPQRRAEGAATAAASPLPPPPLPPPSAPLPRSFWQTVISPPLASSAASPAGAATRGVPPSLPPPRSASKPPLDSNRLLPRARRSPPPPAFDAAAATAAGTATATATASMIDQDGAPTVCAHTDAAVGRGDDGGARPASAADAATAGVATSSRPYACDECGSSHSRSGNLAKHVRLVHGRRRPHGCPECGARFGQRSNLSAHTRAVHRRLRPHACAECTAAFAQKSALVAHVSAVHRRLRPYACTECGCVFCSSFFFSSFRGKRGGGAGRRVVPATGAALSSGSLCWMGLARCQLGPAEEVLPYAAFAVLAD